MQTNVSQNQAPNIPLKAMDIQNSSINQVRYITLSDLASLRPSLISNNISGKNIIGQINIANVNNVLGNINAINIGQGNNMINNSGQVNIARLNNVIGNGQVNIKNAVGNIEQILNNSTGSSVNSSNVIIQKPLIISSLQSSIMNNTFNGSASNDANAVQLKSKISKSSLVNLGSGQNILQMIGNNVGSVAIQNSLNNTTNNAGKNVSNKINTPTYVKVSGSNQIYQLSTLQTSSNTNQTILIPTSLQTIPQQNINNTSSQNKIVNTQPIQMNNSNQVSTAILNIINQKNKNQLAAAIKNLQLPQGAVIIGNSLQLTGNNIVNSSPSQVISLNNLTTPQKGKILLLNNATNQDNSGNVKILPANSSGINESTTLTGTPPRLLAPRIITQNTGIRDVQGLLQKIKDQQIQQKNNLPNLRSINIASAATRPVQIAPLGSSNLSQQSRIIILNNAPTSSISNTLVIRSTPTYNLTPTNAILKSQKIMEEAVAKAKAEGLDFNETDGKKNAKRKIDVESNDNEEVSKKRRVENNNKGKGGRRMEHAEDGSIIFDESIDMSDSEYKNKSKYGRSGKKKKRAFPKFMKKKKNNDSEGSDVDINPCTPTGQDIVEENNMSTRRSARVSNRKKYVDEVDLDLSDSSESEEEVKKKKSRPKSGIIEGDDDDGDGTQNNENGMIEEGESQIVDKVLGMRTGHRVITVKNPNFDPTLVVESKDDDVDLGIHNDTISKTVPVEEYYVKFKYFSYLHCSWKTLDELLVGDKRVVPKIKRFKQKRAQAYMQEDDEEMFNSDYVEVDRVLDMSTVYDSQDTQEQVNHYLVTWKSLPYDEATWELESNVDAPKIEAFLVRKKLPSKEFKPRPMAHQWKTMDSSPVFKNGNVLREYQLEGLNWLTFSYYNKQNCILADEMGLGKTIQSIAFLKAVIDYGIRGPFLIIVPLSTLGNWQREFETWTDINAIVYHGSQTSRDMIQNYEMYYLDDKGNRRMDVFKFQALITTFECVISDFNELSPIEWRVAVIDEAHRLKNRNCKLLQGLNCFELEHRVLLTGTPLQNNVDELFSLLSFLEPRQFSCVESFMADFGKLENETQVDKLKALLKPMMLRRLKEDVEKNLAPKEETIIEVELTNIQKKYYRAILERNLSFLAKGATSNANIPNLMNTMMELRKCCNHPYLVNGAEDQILAELNVERGDVEKHYQTLIQSSGKLVLVDKLLPKLRADDHKVLIFSQMIRVLDIIEDYLIYKKYLYERLDGRITGRVRQEAIDRFSKPDSDRFVFLLCTRAGGLGINLTAADTVIIFDSDWNPQNDIQAQARCHRIGQEKSVKVYRLITRNTYEREMFDRASLKLGLDKAVLQSTANKEINSTQLSKKEVEDFLKKGAYGALMDDDREGEEFCEEDIEQILQRRTKIVQIESGVKGSTFAKASFNMSSNRTDIDIDDPNFWQKWAKKAEIDVDDGGKKKLIMDEPRQRKTTSRYSTANTSDTESDISYHTDEDITSKKTSTRRKKRGGKWISQIGKGKGPYSKLECFAVEKSLCVYGWGRWEDMVEHEGSKHRLRKDDIIKISTAMLVYCLKNYEGDDKIKRFIYDLISPSEDGKEKDYKNHLGLATLVPRGRKSSKPKKDNKIDNDINKLEVDVDEVLPSDNYRKHLKRQANKVLLRVRMLYYLKQEVIGKQAKKIMENYSAGEINIRVGCVDVEIPAYWWDEEADKNLVIGIFKHGYEKYHKMRQDPALCFLERCGPPDSQDLLTEQHSDIDENDDEETDAKIRKKISKRRTKKNIENLTNDGGDEDKPLKSKNKNTTGLNKLPFPNFSDLNVRFRRIITGFQRSHKQGLMKLEQVAKKMHRRDQLSDKHERTTSYNDSPDYKSVHLESVGDNPMRLAEQLNWTRREEAEFYRVVSTYGIERDAITGQYIWDTFRTLAHLERKHDDTLTEYFKAFYHMCMRVCKRLPNTQDGRSSNGLYVLTITEERATRCLLRIDLLSRIRERILFHPLLEERIGSCQPAPYLPIWWICGEHDKDLLIGAAKHGLCRTDTNIKNDPKLSFYKVAKHFDEMDMGEKNEILDLSDVKSEISSGRSSQIDKLIATVESIGSSHQVNVENKLKYLNESEDNDLKTDDLKKITLNQMNDINEIGKDLNDVKFKNSKGNDESNGLELQSKTFNGIKVENSIEVKVSSTDEVKIESENAELEEKEYVDGVNEQLIGDDTLENVPNNKWPKDRLIFCRLENICHFIETGKWRTSHRHNNLPFTAGILDPMDLEGALNPQDYSVMAAAAGADPVDILKLRFQKRRYRRSKAEIQAEKDFVGSLNASQNDGLSDQEIAGEMIDGTKKSKLYGSSGRKKIWSNMEQQRVPLINTLDGSLLVGHDAPTVAELDTFLELHPNYMIDSSFIDATEVERPQLRRARFNPSRLSLEDMTGEENVTVVHNETGRKLSGVKAPMVMDLVEWLEQNPAYSVDPKWAAILKQLTSFPESLYNRVIVDEHEDQLSVKTPIITSRRIKHTKPSNIQNIHTPSMHMSPPQRVIYPRSSSNSNTDEVAVKDNSIDNNICDVIMEETIEETVVANEADMNVL